MEYLSLYDQLGSQELKLYSKPAGLVTAEDVATRLDDQIRGKTVLVTGCGLASLGKHIAWTIASHSPRQIIICGRSDVRLRLLASNLRHRNPGLDIQHEVFDLADLAQVRAAAERINAPERPAVDVIICNAAIMMQPLRKTVDGLESHFGINSVAHFVLVNALLPRMIANGGGRIVTTTSGAFVFQGIRWDDPNYEVSFATWG
jgi:NAD(P)-dependent dehydrogenase (short-subunit alcohol dehydrogenase family)